MSKRSGWDERLSVTTSGKGLAGHAGAVLLRRCADRTGLTRALSLAMPKGAGPGWWDRGTVLVSLAVSIALGATSMSDIDVLAHQTGVFGGPPSDSTVRRTLEALDEVALQRIAKARRKVRRRVWDLLAQRPGGFPWLCVAGKLLSGWIDIDLDATLITANSPKQSAAATFKRGFGFHPLAGWCANTQECLAMLLRLGNAGSNTIADHIRVLGEAIAQLPLRYQRKILIRVDGAGATHELLEHLTRMNTIWRRVRFTVGWAITDADEDAIAAVPASDWCAYLRPDGGVSTTAGVAELTGLDTRAQHWVADLRLIVRRTRPTARHKANLTAFERRTGWRYVIVATNITRMWGIAGSHEGTGSQATALWLRYRSDATGAVPANLVPPRTQVTPIFFTNMTGGGSWNELYGGTAAFDVWLPAGRHVVGVDYATHWCAGSGSQGSFRMQNLHVQVVGS